MSSKNTTARTKKDPSAPNKAYVRKDRRRWKHEGWTSAPNSIIRNEALKPEQIWAWIWLASHNEEFEVSGQTLWAANEHIGRDKAFKLLDALEEHGLLVRTHEKNERGIPYIVYDLQPTPVPEEQRTWKPSKAKPRKSAFASDQDKPVSCTFRKPATTSENGDQVSATADGPGFLHVQETGDDQGKRNGDDEALPGGVFPARVVPERAGEFYREEKTNEEDQPAKEAGWLAGEEQSGEDAEGTRLLRSLPYGIGEALSGPCVTEWAPVVSAALRAGWSEQSVITKLTHELPNDRSRHARIVVGRRLPDLQTSVNQAPRRSVERAQSATEQAHAQIDQWVQQGAAGARRAAALRGEYFDPEAQRGNTPAQEWLTERLPAISREFIEQRRESLVQVLTARAAA